MCKFPYSSKQSAVRSCSAPSGLAPWRFIISCWSLLEYWGESSEQTVKSGETKFPIRLCVKCSTDFLPPGGHNKSVKSGYFRPFVTFHISESRRPKSEHIFNKYYVAWVLKKIRSNRPVKSKIKRNRRNRPILFLLFAHLTRPWCGRLAVPMSYLSLHFFCFYLFLCSYKS